MKRKASPMGDPQAKRIIFEAALSPMGNCFSLNGDGEARLTLVVPESTAKPLVEAMAAGWLRDTTFLVTIAKPDSPPK